MKRLILALISLVLLVAEPAIASVPLRRAALFASLIISVSLLVHGVVVRRRRGESWNATLAGDTKLMTGNVWLDGAVFAGILVVIIAAVALLFLYA
jgi:hypothetical protein